jgi:hypothetical protein
MKLSKNTKKFLAAIAERSIKTFIQTFAAVSASANLFNSATTTDLLGVAASAALLSIATSVVSAKFGAHGPSLTTEVVVNDQVAGH